MKKNILTILVFTTVVFSCKKNDLSSQTVTPTENSHEVSMEQAVKTLTGTNGEKLTLEYFAEGNEVAVKVNKNNEGEHKLNAKGATDRGNPLFSDGEVVWEMNDDGTSGTLTEKNGKVTVFK